MFFFGFWLFDPDNCGLRVLSTLSAQHRSCPSPRFLVPFFPCYVSLIPPVRPFLVKHGLLQTRLRPETSDHRNSTRKSTKSTFAIQAAVPAMPAKPSRAASRAMIKKARVQFNIISPFHPPRSRRRESAQFPSPEERGAPTDVGG